MINTITLKTTGFHLSFELNRSRSDHEYVAMIIVFRVNPHLGNVSVQTERTSIATEDLRQLIRYFEEHIAHLQQDPWSDSHTFVNMELDFQIQALAGWVESPCEGKFGISCMVNIGNSNEDGSRVYIGGEANVTLEQIHVFTDSIKALLTELGASTSTAA